jgi:hypothetical protein
MVATEAYGKAGFAGFCGFYGHPARDFYLRALKKFWFRRRPHPCRILQIKIHQLNQLVTCRDVGFKNPASSTNNPASFAKNGLSAIRKSTISRTRVRTCRVVDRRNSNNPASLDQEPCKLGPNK